MEVLPSASIPNLMLHESTDRSTVDAQEVVLTWLSALESTIKSGELSKLQDLFMEDSWWRDLISLSWDIKSCHGVPNISQHLQESKVGLFNLKPVENSALVPKLADMGPFTLVESAFDFETRIGKGQGYLKLGNTGPSEWKAWIIMTALKEIEGHEELHKVSAAPNWVTVADAEVYNEMAQKNPRVVVVGAGHSGLAIAARLKQLGVPTLLVDKQGRVGDSWRKRYLNLSLHDPVWENHMPYFKFPETFPTWIPKDMIADWLEHYQSILQLPVRLDSKITNTKWDEVSKSWTVEIISEKDGSKTYLKSGHIILATGLHSDTPAIPEFDDKKTFKGQILHSTEFTTASDIPDFKKKKFIIIGSSASAHDIAQDLAEAGVDVTIVQRDANCVYSLDTKVKVVGGAFLKPGISTDDADIYSVSTPMPVALTMMIGGTQMIYQMDKEMLDKLGKTEFKFLKGDDGRGLLHILLAKGGGHYPDQGSIQLIIDGKIKVRQCYEGIQRLMPEGLVLADGRQVNGDVIIMSTGYQLGSTTVRKVLGDEVADRCGPLFGFDKNGEISGWFRSPGVPGFWWMAGSFSINRFYSRLLALQIKAIEVGMNPEHYSVRKA